MLLEKASNPDEDLFAIHRPGDDEEYQNETHTPGQRAQVGIADVSERILVEDVLDRLTVNMVAVERGLAPTGEKIDSQRIHAEHNERHAPALPSANIDCPVA